jgi:hypothetical protein
VAGTATVQQHRARTAVRAVSVELLPHLRRARDHIDRYYQQPLDLAELAAVAGVSGNWVVLVEPKEFTPADFG